MQFCTVKYIFAKNHHQVNFPQSVEKFNDLVAQSILKIPLSYSIYFNNIDGYRRTEIHTI